MNVEDKAIADLKYSLESDKATLIKDEKVNKDEWSKVAEKYLNEIKAKSDL